jgi:alpha-N-arabinofuranosidase
MVNVLQAVLLTEGADMIKTPTYHVFHQYMYHQGGKLLDSALTGCDDITSGEWTVPGITESVSMDEDGIVTITVNNLSTTDKKTLDISFAGGEYEVIEASTVTGEIHAHNTFDAPETVKEVVFSDYAKKDGAICADLPAASVTMFRLKKA